MALTDLFDDEMLRIYDETKKRTGYSAKRFLIGVRKNGGHPTAIKMIRRKTKDNDGLWKLALFGELELSVEHAILQATWKPLFTDADRAEAKSRLEQAKLLGLLPYEFPDSDDLFEGGRFRVLVNAYERNPEARKECIKHYGAVCVVCKFDFEKRYGPLGKGIIEVHHLESIAISGKKHKINPIKELRPVCPNCHTIIHLGGETRTIEEVQALLK